MSVQPRLFDNNAPKGYEQEREVAIGMILRRIPTDGIAVSQLRVILNEDSIPMMHAHMFFSFGGWLHEQQGLPAVLRRLRKRRALRQSKGSRENHIKEWDHITVYPGINRDAIVAAFSRPAKEWLARFPLSLLDQIASA